MSKAYTQDALLFVHTWYWTWSFSQWPAVHPHMLLDLVVFTMTCCSSTHAIGLGRFHNDLLFVHTWYWTWSLSQSVTCCSSTHGTGLGRFHNGLLFVHTCYWTWSFSQWPAVRPHMVPDLVGFTVSDLLFVHTWYWTWSFSQWPRADRTAEATIRENNINFDSFQYSRQLNEIVMRWRERHWHWHWHIFYCEGHRPIHKEGGGGLYNSVSVFAVA